MPKNIISFNKTLFSTKYPFSQKIKQKPPSAKFLLQSNAKATLSLLIKQAFVSVWVKCSSKHAII
jgi:hypothetical protein